MAWQLNPVRQADRPKQDHSAQRRPEAQECGYGAREQPQDCKDSEELHRRASTRITGKWLRLMMATRRAGEASAGSLTPSGDPRVEGGIHESPGESLRLQFAKTSRDFRNLDHSLEGAA